VVPPVGWMHLVSIGAVANQLVNTIHYIQRLQGWRMEPRFTPTGAQAPVRGKPAARVSSPMENHVPQPATRLCVRSFALRTGLPVGHPF